MLSTALRYSYLGFVISVGYHHLHLTNQSHIMSVKVQSATDPNVSVTTDSLLFPSLPYTPLGANHTHSSLFPRTVVSLVQ